MSLRLKFNIVLAASFLVALMAASAAFYWMSYRNSLDRLHAQIVVLRAQALAVRAYTADEIRPLISDMSDVQFLPQSVPSFSAQTVFRKFRDEYPDFYYKEAALNPTNSSDLAAPWEAELINKLRSDASLKEIATYRNTDKGRHYTVAFPITIKSEGCLTCHSTPDKAPASMIALYGDKGGFGWRMNETIGAQVISVPVAVAQQQAWENLKFLMAAVSLIFAGLLVLLNYLLDRLVIVPVVKMSEIAERVSLGDSSLPEYTYPGNDEIASLSRSFNRMRRSLDSAMKMLQS